MIYLLEDDEKIRNFVIYALESSGFEARGFELPSEFRNAVSEKVPELVILDIMLPEEDGFSVLKKIRSNHETEKIPVIMLSAKGTESDKINALDSGADDYVTKPFGIRELISRVKAVSRRYSDRSESPVLSIGILSVDTSKHEVFSGNSKISLTLKEYEMLVLLLKNRGRVFSREELLSQIWGYDFQGESRTVDVHIRTLRSKLGESGELVHTVRGIGYKLDEVSVI